MKSGGWKSSTPMGGYIKMTRVDMYHEVLASGQSTESSGTNPEQNYV